MKKILSILIGLAFIPSIALAQITVPQGGSGQSSFPAGNLIIGDTSLRLNSTSSPTVGWITATNTNATSTLQRTSISGAISLLGEYFTNFTTYVRSLFSNTGEDYISYSNGVITANSIDPDNLSSADFGDFTCNGTSCSLDATYLTGNETITLSGDVTGSGATSITTTISSGAVDPAMLSNSDFGAFTCSAGVCSLDTSYLSSYDAFTHPASGKSATTSELQITGGLLSTASSTFSSAVRFSSLSQGLGYFGTGGLLGSTATTTASCSGSVSCTGFVVLGSSPITISGSGGGSGGGTWATTTSTVAGQNVNYSLEDDDIVAIGSNSTTTAEFYFDPNTLTAQFGAGGAGDSTFVFGPNGYEWATGFDDTDDAWKISSSTTLGTNDFFSISKQGTTTIKSSILTQGFVSQASSTIVGPLRVTGEITGNLTGNVTGNADTATALASNGSNCSSGNAPLGVDQNGAVESCFDVWTEAENTAAAYTPQSRTLTVAGTSNQITSSAGAQDLSANRTWTLSFPNQVIFPQYASTTLGFSTPYASSTALYAGGLTISTGGTITIGGDSIDEFVGDGLDISSGDLIFDCSDVAGTGITCSGEDITASLGTAIDTSEITDGTILEADLNATNSPSDNQILSYDQGSGGFTWVDDQTGAGGSAGAQASTTATYIVYTQGGIYYAYNSTTTAVTSNADFSTLLQSLVNVLDDGASVIGHLGGSIHIKQGVYYANTVVTINGNNEGGSNDSGSILISGEGQDATKIVVANNTNFLDFDNAAMPKVRDMSIYVKGTGVALFADGSNNDARAVWNFQFENLSILATTTHTGWGIDMGNTFRGTYTNIEMFGLGNCARWTAEGDFNPGDFVWSRSFCELGANTNGVSYEFRQSGAGFMNQVHFEMAEGIANATGQKFIDADYLSYSEFYGLNAEQYDVLVDIRSGESNYFNFNYATHRAGAAGLRGCRFWAGAYNNRCDFKFLNTTENFTVVDDMDDWGDTPNVISGYIGSDSGTASASTTGFTIFRDIKGYGTLDTTLAPGGDFGVFDIWGPLRLRGVSDGCLNITSGIVGSQACGGGASFGYPFPSNATSTALTFSGGITVSGSSLTVSSSIALDTNGVTFDTDGDGALIITGASTGSDEDLIFNFDDTADSVVITSSTGVAVVDFGTINLRTDALQNTGDTDTGIFFASDVIALTAGNVNAFTITESTSDVITIGNYGVDAGDVQYFEIPNGTNPTCDDTGEICHDTTANDLIIDDFVIPAGSQEIFSRTIASTSVAFIEGGIMPLPTKLRGFTITAIRCKVDGGTSKVLAIEDESGNSSEDITCTTSVTSDDGSITNATYTAAEEAFIDFGSTSGSVNYVSVSVFGTWTRQ